ncbi:MAG: BLUF domain-containing protein [Sphingobacteriales bacterium]
MYYLIYLSAGVNWFSEKELTDILSVSITNNSRDNITGLLLYSEGNFIQLLEGNEQDVKNTFERISKDQRHKGITPIASGAIEKRNFPEWAMGFKSIYSRDLKELDAYNDPSDREFLNDKDKHLSINLLKAFIKTARRIK